MFSLIEQLTRGPRFEPQEEPRQCCLTGAAKLVADVVADLPEDCQFSSMFVKDKAGVSAANTTSALRKLEQCGYLKIVHYDRKRGSTWRRIKSL